METDLQRNFNNNTYKIFTNPALKKTNKKHFNKIPKSNLENFHMLPKQKKKIPKSKTRKLNQELVSQINNDNKRTDSTNLSLVQEDIRELWKVQP